MKAVEFCYWLQGFFEIRDANRVIAPGISESQVTTIKTHLALVFKHEIDPSYSADPKVQAEMNAIHDAAKKRPPKRPPRPSEGPGSFGGDVVYRC